jgi:hypothetical protein
MREEIDNAAAGSIRTWGQFAVGALVFVVVVGGLQLASTGLRASPGEQTLAALWFAAQLLAFACAGAVLLWLLMRAAKGRDGAPEFRDSVLWSACLIGGLVMLVRMVS